MMKAFVRCPQGRNALVAQLVGLARRSRGTSLASLSSPPPAPSHGNGAAMGRGARSFFSSSASVSAHRAPEGA